MAPRELAKLTKVQVYAPRVINGAARADFTWDPAEPSPARSPGATTDDAAMRVGWCSATHQFHEGTASGVRGADVGVFRIENTTVFFMRNGWPLFLDQSRSEYLFSDILGMRAAFFKDTAEMRGLPQRKLGVLVDTRGERVGIENAVIMESPGFKVWGHWIVDQYPRLYLLQLLGLISQANFVFFNPPPSWASSFLDLFGVRKEQLHVLEKRTFRLDAVYVPSFYREREKLFEAYLARAWRELKSSLLKADQEPPKRPSGAFGHLLDALKSFAGAQPDAPHSPSRIYLSRGKWGSNIVNEPEVAKALAELGFETVYPEERSLADQARLMDRADVIVGEDGSAMHNLVFCRDNSASVTIYSRVTAKTPAALRPSRYQKLISEKASPLGHFYEPNVEGERVKVNIADFKAFLIKTIDEQSALKRRAP
jgi:capsular polysaccharide biosynthesis protein